jgi:membrane protease YdiL (CAAX protease family)
VPDPSASTTFRAQRGAVDLPVAAAAWVVSWIVGQLLTAVVIQVTGAADEEVLPIGTLAVAVMATWCAYLAGTWWASQKGGSGDLRRDLAIWGDPLDLIGVGVGVVTQLVLVPVVYLPLRAVWPDTFSDDRLEETARDLVDRAEGAAFLVLVVVVVVGAPLVEELVYRGLLQRSLAARLSDPLALVGASLWFAAIHFRPVEYPGLFVAGLVFGACLLVTGRLGTAVAAHVGFNATGIATVLLA